MTKFLVLMAGIAFIFWAAPGTASADCDRCGDVNGDGAVNPVDVVLLINWFITFPPQGPPCPCAGDVNCDHAVTANVNDWWDPDTDVGYLLNYVYLYGPDPCDPDDDGEPDCDPCG
jgi:hypothetical protein